MAMLATVRIGAVHSVVFGGKFVRDWCEHFRKHFDIFWKFIDIKYPVIVSGSN